MSALNLFAFLSDHFADVHSFSPQGTYHNVVRWVHRSTFVLRPHSRSHSSRIPIPESNGLFVDPGWYGTVVVETEGTNEALADLQDRCGPGAFPPRPRGATAATPAQTENRKVFRILREKRYVVKGLHIP